MSKASNVIISILKILLFILIVPVCVFATCYFADLLPKDYRDSIYERFQIEIPQGWKAVYYNQGSLGGFAGEGTSYHVYQTTEGTEEFVSEFSQTKDAEFESTVTHILEQSFDGEKISESEIDTEYKFDLTKPYEWFYKYIDGATDADEKSTRDAEIIMIYQSQKIYIFTTYRI